MRFNLMSSFAGGIFLATSIIAGVYVTSDKNDIAKANSKPTADQQIRKLPLSEKEMKDKLISSGYVVQKKEEYEKNLKKVKKSDAKATAPSDGSENKVVFKAIVNVSQGMTSIDVGNILQKANIIPNAFKFSKDIESRGLENNLRPGTFVVDSQMPYDQIISTIFKK